MFAITEATKLAHHINQQLPILSEIGSEVEHEQALELMEQLLEDYDNNLLLIEALSSSISRYEDNAPEFVEFNNQQAHMDPAVTTLKVLMEQYKLNTTDFENEIGKKSMVSQVLNGKKDLTKKHITKLSKRFGISPALFF